MYFICVDLGEGEEFINWYSPHFFSHLIWAVLKLYLYVNIV